MIICSHTLKIRKTAAGYMPAAVFVLDVTASIYPGRFKKTMLQLLTIVGSPNANLKRLL